MKLETLLKWCTKIGKILVWIGSGAAIGFLAGGSFFGSGIGYTI